MFGGIINRKSPTNSIFEIKLKPNQSSKKTFYIEKLDVQ